MNLAMSMSPPIPGLPAWRGPPSATCTPAAPSSRAFWPPTWGQCGFTAVNDGPADLYTSILGEGFDPEAVVDGWGDAGPAGPLRIEQNYTKYHACCLYNHPILDAAMALQRREGFSADAVKSIDVTAPPIVQIMANAAPANMLSAKFSIPYAPGRRPGGGRNRRPRLL